jgi:type IV pilus assembly protein PilC
MQPTAAQPESFLFIAAKIDGKKTLGMRSALDEGLLARELSKQKLVLIRSWRVPGWLAGQTDKPLSLKDQAEMTVQLSQLLSRGVPLVETLEVTTEAVSNKSKPRIEQLRELVRQGKSFSDAALETKTFDHATAAVFRASEKTGDLAGSADQLAKNAKRRIKIKETAQTLMFYPLIVLTISMMVGVFMLVFVVPQVAEAMTSAMGPDRDLPWATRTLASVGIFIRSNPLMILGGILVVITGILLARNFLASILSKLSHIIPVLKDVTLAQESARFFSVMAALATGGVPLAEALGVANSTIHHTKLRIQLDELRQSLIDGGVLRVLIDRIEAFPIGTRRLLIAADRAGNLDAAFESLAEDHTEQVERLSSRLLAVLEPLLIVAIFVVIGGMILAIMAPMLSLSRNAFG